MGREEVKKGNGMYIYIYIYIYRWPSYVYIYIYALKQILCIKTILLFRQYVFIFMINVA